MNDLVKTLSERLRAKQWSMVSAESCTGGMIAAAITGLAGSSDIFDRGFVTYSNQSKIDMLGVSALTLAQHGAVSEQTAAEMAMGALEKSGADISVATTGIAGPSGGTAEKPVGLVYIAVARKGKTTTVFRHVFGGTRENVRCDACLTALSHLQTILIKDPS